MLSYLFIMETKNPQSLEQCGFSLLRFGGRYWDRTSDPCRVKAVLYR